MAVRSRRFVCTRCTFEFERVCGSLYRHVKCPKCKHKFKRIDGVQMPQSVRKPMMDCVVPIGTIRGNQVPTSLAEARFKKKAFARGWKAHRPSWPDFLVETPKGFIGVEVKSSADTVSREQAATFDLLEQAGLPIYVWKTGATSLKRWAAGDLELSQPRSRDGLSRLAGNPGEDPKGAGYSPNRSTTQGEQYPGEAVRSAGAGNGLARGEGS